MRKHVSPGCGLKAEIRARSPRNEGARIPLRCIRATFAETLQLINEKTLPTTRPPNATRSVHADRQWMFGGHGAERHQATASAEYKRRASVGDEVGQLTIANRIGLDDTVQLAARGIEVRIHVGHCAASERFGQTQSFEHAGTTPRMCSHYQLIRDIESARRRFGVELPPGIVDLWPGYAGVFLRRPAEHGAGDEAVPAIEAVTGHWGLIPFFSKDGKPKSTFNASGTFGTVNFSEFVCHQRLAYANCFPAGTER